MKKLVITLLILLPFQGKSQDCFLGHSQQFVLEHYNSNPGYYSALHQSKARNGKPTISFKSADFQCFYEFSPVSGQCDGAVITFNNVQLFDKMFKTLQRESVELPKNECSDCWLTGYEGKPVQYMKSQIGTVPQLIFNLYR
jgi:hypothetical protein